MPPHARRAVHDALTTLARNPRAGVAEPITAALIRRITTVPQPTPTGSPCDRVHAADREADRRHQPGIAAPNFDQPLIGVEWGEAMV